MVKSLPDLKMHFLKYAYAIEYDAIRTEERGPTLEIKIPGLYWWSYVALQVMKRFAALFNRVLMPY